MGKRATRKFVGAAIAVGLVAAGCGSSKGTASTSASASGHTYTIGILTDLTGAAAGTEASVIPGIKAGIGEVTKDGYHFKYVVGDAQTSPSGALTAAEKLVEQDHVFAVIAVSALTFAASSFFTSHNVPVIGSATDGPEWTTARNMFPVEGSQDYNKVFSTLPKFLKMEGVTNLASVGYGITPSSKLSTEATASGAQALGITSGYLNANFPFGGTNVGPVALQIKQAGANGLYAGVETATSFSLVTALHQDGVAMKAELLPIGYGGDLLSGGPSAEQDAQGVYFTVSFEPAEMHTAATETLQKALSTYAGVHTDPTLNEYFAYASVLALVKGLEAAGSHPTQASLINAMLGITNFNAGGLYGSHSISFAMGARGQVSGPGNCVWITQFRGTSFHLVPGADPICGSIIPGRTVS